ncbi:MAG: hypothetical protein JXB32_13985 [Deltaproteobacteria bacterium]|nr:hypothetical protein [Deltaproteobacteria bacterium]
MRRRHAIQVLWLAAAVPAACGGDDAATDTGRPDDAATADADVPEAAPDAPPDDDGDAPAEDGAPADAADVPDDVGPEDAGDGEATGEPVWSTVELGVQGIAYDVGRDNAGGVHLLRKVGNSLFYARLDGGAVAGDEELPDSGWAFTRFTRPRLAVRPDGSTVHTCWTNSDGTRNGTLFHAWRDVAGAWHREAIWDCGGSMDRVVVPALGVDADGSVHVVVQRWTEGTSDGAVTYARKAAGGGWSAWSDLHVFPPEMRHIAGFTDRTGGFHATWKGWAVPGRYRHAPPGATLDGPAATAREIALPDGVASVGMGDLFAGADGTVFHAFTTFNDYSIHCVRLGPGGASFEWLGRPSGGPLARVEPYDPWPAVAADDGGRVLVAWADQSGAIEAARVDTVHVATRDGDDWAVQVLDAAAELDPESKPALTVASGRAWLVWRGDGGLLRLATAPL